MGLFGSKPKRKRAPNKTADEKLKLEEARLLAHARKANPHLYDKISQQYLEAKFGLTQKKEDPFEEFESTVTRLRKMFPAAFKDPSDLDNDGIKPKDIIEALAGVGMLMQTMQGGQVATPTAAAPPPLPAPAQQSAESDAEPAQAENPPQEVPMSLMSRIVIGQLDGKTPEEGAQWLLSQNAPQAKQLIELLCQTSDDNLPQLLQAIAQQVPDLAGLVTWLRQRPEWLVATVRAIRSQAQPVKVAAAGL